MASSSRSVSSLLAGLSAVLFDLDGVITPTAIVHERAWRQVFEEVLPFVASSDQSTYRDDDYQLYIDGRSRYEGVAALLEAHGVDLPAGLPSDEPGIGTVCAIGNKKNDVFARILATESIEPYPDALEVMQRLSSNGAAMALVSSSKNAGAVLASAGLSSAFPVMIDGNVIAARGLKGKPHPDPFLEAARRLDLDPADCAVVEDAISGVEAGAAGQFGLVVGVDRIGDPESLRGAGADVVVSDLRELL